MRDLIEGKRADLFGYIEAGNTDGITGFLGNKEENAALFTAVNEQNYNALMWACEKGQLESVRAILESCQDDQTRKKMLAQQSFPPKGQAKGGNDNALMLACQHENQETADEMAKVLVAALGQDQLLNVATKDVDGSREKRCAWRIALEKDLPVADDILARILNEGLHQHFLDQSNSGLQYEKTNAEKVLTLLRQNNRMVLGDSLQAKLKTEDTRRNLLGMLKQKDEGVVPNRLTAGMGELEKNRLNTLFTALIQYSTKVANDYTIKGDRDALKKFIAFKQFVTEINSKDLTQHKLQDALDRFEQADINRGTGLYRLKSFFSFAKLGGKRYNDPKHHRFFRPLVKSSLGERVYDFAHALMPQLPKGHEMAR